VSTGASDSKPLIRREQTPADASEWTRLEAELSRVNAQIAAARTRREAARARAAQARAQLDAIDAKIALARPRGIVVKATAPTVSSHHDDDDDDDDDDEPPPPPMSRTRSAGVLDDAFAQRCRVAMGQLLSNCAAASKAGDDAVVFGDAARDAMLATKDVLALVDEFHASPAELSQRDGARDAAALVKERVVVLVRTGKEKLSSGFLGVSPDDPAVSDAVRNVALGVKALMLLMIPSNSARQSGAASAPASAPPPPGASVSWDEVAGDAPPPVHSDSDDERGSKSAAPVRSPVVSAPAGDNKWAGAAARQRQERQQELAAVAKKTAGTRSSSGHELPMTTLRIPELQKKQTPPVVEKKASPAAIDYNSDDSDDLFGDLDDVVKGEEIEETPEERDARVAKLQAAIDAKVTTSSRFKAAPVLAAPGSSAPPPPALSPKGSFTKPAPAGSSPKAAPPGSSSPKGSFTKAASPKGSFAKETAPAPPSDDGEGGAAVADFVDEELVAYEREQAANAALAAAAEAGSSKRVKTHDRTNEQIRVTVMYVLGGLDHEGATCELALGGQTRTTAAAATRFGWYETLVFGREAAKPSMELRFTVRERGAKADGGAPSTTSRASSHALSTLRTMVRKVEAKTTSRNSSRAAGGSASASALPVDGGAVVLSLGDESVPFGSVVAKQCALRGKQNRVVGELFVYVERCEPSEVSRRAGVPPSVRVNEHAVRVQPCRYTVARAALTSAERNDASKAGGAVPAALEEASDADRRTDLALKYDTPLQQACKWPPLLHKVIDLLEAELAKLPVAEEGDELSDLPSPTRGKQPQFDVEFHNSRYQTYLHFAAEAKRADLVKRLLSLRPQPNPDLRDSFGASPLHIAAALNDAATIDVLIKGGATLENVSPFTGEVPLHYAAQCGSTQAVVTMLENGAQSDPIDDSGCTPLHHAAYCGERAVAATLLQTARAFRAAETRNGTTPMLLAALRGHTELSGELAGPNVAVDNAFGDSLLWGAVINYDWAQCAKLIRGAGFASIDAPQLGALSMSCLERALLERPKEEHGKLVPALLLAGASATHSAADGKTPLHFAAYFSDAATIKRLIAAGADVNAADQSGSTPLHFASSVEAVRALLDAGADIHKSNKQFNTALHVARALHGEEVTRALVEKGADGSMANENGNQARELLRVGAPPAGIYFVAPKAPLVLPSGCGGIFLPKLNEQS
jgi:ankyrin repeat protein